MKPWSLLVLIYAPPAMAGLVPGEVMVLAAEDPQESALLAQHYQARRGLDPDHVCLLPGPYPEVLSLDAYNEAFWPRVAECLADRRIGAIVTTKGLPVRVGGYSLEALLALGDSVGARGRLREQPQQRQGWLANPFYGRAPYDGLPPFRRGQLPRGFRPGDGEGHGLDFRLTSRLDGFTYDQAQALVQRSIESDGAGIDGDWLCMAGRDPARGIRDRECLAMLDLIEELGWARTQRLDYDPQLAGHRLAGYFTGSAALQEAIAGNFYPPGAIADNITSLMGVPGNFGTGQFCDDDSDCDEEAGEHCVETVCLGEAQTSVARFIAAGITGVHATAAEPYNNSFPSSLMMALYLQGYSLAESVFFSLPFLGWVNVVYGDPLAAPYARPIAVQVGAELTLAEHMPLRLEFEQVDGWRVAQVEVFFAGDLLLDEHFSRLETDPLLVWDPGLDVGDYPLELRVRSEPIGQTLGPSFSAGMLWPEPQVMSQQTLMLRVQKPSADAGLGAETPDTGAGCSCAGGGGIGWSWIVLLFLFRRRLA